MTEDINRPAGDSRTMGPGAGGAHAAPAGPPAAPPPAPSAPAPVRTGPVESSEPDANDTKQAAKQGAAQVADTAKQDAQQVAQTAKQEGRRTAGEAKRQAQDLLRQSQTELNDQAGAQQQRLAGGLRDFSAELGQMVDGAEQEGIASHMASWAAEASDDAGRWLEDRDPSAVLEEIKGFARRRPGMFIIAAAGAGLLVGRIARSLRDNVSDDDASETTRGAGQASGAGVAPTTGYPQTSTGAGPVPPSPAPRSEAYGEPGGWR